MLLLLYLPFSVFCRGVSTATDFEREPICVEAGERGEWPVGKTDRSLRGPPQVRRFALSLQIDPSEIKVIKLYSAFLLYCTQNYELLNPQEIKRMFRRA